MEADNGVGIYTKPAKQISPNPPYKPKQSSPNGNGGKVPRETMA